MPHFLMKVGGSEQADLGRPVLLNPGWGGGGGGGGDLYLFSGRIQFWHLQRRCVRYKS